jgi:hypothetical protein
VKFLTSLLLLSGLGLSLSGCNTLSTRRDLYSPTRANGPYTKQYVEMRDQEGLAGVSHNVHHPVGDDEGIFGVSHNPHEAELPADDEGIFGISHNHQ